jgi:hypothetical protein
MVPDEGVELWKLGASDLGQIVKVIVQLFQDMINYLSKRDGAGKTQHFNSIFMNVYFNIAPASLTFSFLRSLIDPHKPKKQFDRQHQELIV